MSGTDTLTVRDSYLAARWKPLLEDRFNVEIERAALEAVDGEGCVALPVTAPRDQPSLDKACPELVEALLSNPTATLRVGQAILNTIDVPCDPRPLLTLRVKALPQSRRRHPHQLRAKDLGGLYSLPALVLDRTRNEPAVREAMFECKKCTTRMRILQDDEKLQEPVHCDTCERQSTWRFIESESRHVDHIKLQIQTPWDLLEDVSNPEPMTVEIDADLVYQGGRYVAEPGDRVLINGILASKAMRRQNTVQVSRERILQAISIEEDQDFLETLESTPEEQDAFKALATLPDVHNRLAECIAPSLHGMAWPKMGILFSLATCGDLDGPDGRRILDRLHIIIAGDPGLAKSKLLKAIAQYVPRCEIAVGAGARSTGLVGTTTQNESTGRYYIQPGKVTRAHRGFLLIDEGNRIDPRDLESLYMPLSDGFAQKDDASGGQKMPAETTVLFFMNPRRGLRFDDYSPRVEQLELEAPFLSRFPLIFCLVDKADKERDTAVAHAQAQTRDDRDVKERFGVDLDATDLRKYIHMAQQIKVVVGEDARAALREFYLQLRGRNRECPEVDARFHEALLIITRASARLRFASEATVQDAERAMELMSQSLVSRGAMDKETGAIDLDVLVGGQSRSQHETVAMVLAIVKDICRETPEKIARKEDVLERAVDAGLLETKADWALDQLMRNHTVYAAMGRGTYRPLSDSTRRQARRGA